MGLQTRIFAEDGLNVLAGERVRLAAGPYTYVLFDDAELDVPGPETVTYEKPGSREGACPHAPVLFDDAELDVPGPETVTYEKPGSREGACPHAPVLFDDGELYVPDPETVTYEYNTANEPEHSQRECVARQAFSIENAERVTKMRKAGDSPRAQSHACRRTRLAWYSPRFPRRTVSKYQGDGSVTHAEYTWFAGNQLKRVDSTFPGECDVAYITDGLGKRRLKSVDPDGAAEVTWYRYDAGWNEIASYNDTGDFWDIGTRSSSFFYAGMTALARVGGSNPSSSLWWYPYMHDYLGSARATYLGSTRMGSTDYLPYGEVRQAVGIQPGFTFTGKRHDAETGLYYFPYRYYSPTTARWLSRDPLGMVDGPNVYAYVGGRPVVSTDPTGLWFGRPFPEECLSAPSATQDSGICDEYECEEHYAGWNLKCVCENAGDSVWAQQVRGCLACAHKNGASPLEAHVKCYRQATHDQGGSNVGDVLTTWQKCLEPFHIYTDWPPDLPYPG